MLWKNLFTIIVSLWAAIASAQEAPDITKVISLDIGLEFHEGEFELDFDIGGNKLFVADKLSKSKPDIRVIRVYDLETQELIKTLRHADGEKFISFGNTQGFGDAISANKKFMVTANTSDEGIRQVLVYDTVSLELLLTIDNPNPDAGTYIDFSDFILPKNALADNLLTMEFQNEQKQNGIFVFDVETGQQITSIVATGLKQGFFNTLFDIKERTIFTVLDFNGTHVLAKDLDVFSDAKSREKSDKIYVFDVKNSSILQTFDISSVDADITPDSGFIHHTTAFVLGRGSINFKSFYNIYAFDLNTGDLKYTLTDVFATSEIQGIQKQKNGIFGSETALAWPYLIVYMPDLLVNNDPSEAFLLYNAETGEQISSSAFPRRPQERLQFLDFFYDDGFIIITEMGDPTRANHIDIFTVD